MAGVTVTAHAQAHWHHGVRLSLIWILATVTYDVVRHVQYHGRTSESCTGTYDIVRATYDIVLNILHMMSPSRTSTYDIQDVDVRHRTCDIVRHVRCHTSTCDIIGDAYDIVRVHLHISYTMSYVGNGYTMSYVHDIRYRMFISYTTSYVPTM